jgi:hypothetical protein
MDLVESAVVDGQSLTCHLVWFAKCLTVVSRDDHERVLELTAALQAVNEMFYDDINLTDTALLKMEDGNGITP